MATQCSITIYPRGWYKMVRRRRKHINICQISVLMDLPFLGMLEWRDNNMFSWHFYCLRNELGYDDIVYITFFFRDDLFVWNPNCHCLFLSRWITFCPVSAFPEWRSLYLVCTSLFHMCVRNVHFNMILRVFPLQKFVNKDDHPVL